MRQRTPRLIAWTCALFAVVLVAVPMSAGAAKKQLYVVTPLVSNGGVPAAHTDAHLVNGWGLASTPTSPWWVADNGADLSTLYDGSGNKQTREVAVPGGPTGEVFNPTTSFKVTKGTVSAAALFIWATESGTILGWNPAADPANAIQEVPNANSPDDGAVYKGLAFANGPAGPELYATDFHNNKVDVFDGNWDPVNTPGAFVDPRLPKGYAPFGIQTIGTRIFVTYAKQDAAAHDDVKGPGFGFVDVYDSSGKLLHRVASQQNLNAPWGLALAPAGFGDVGGDLLVGNFGDGHINAFKELPGGFFRRDGFLLGTDGDVVHIDGLWALEFGKAGSNGPAGTLFFTAGPNGESDGLFGSITPG